MWTWTETAESAELGEKKLRNATNCFYGLKRNEFALDSLVRIYECKIDR